MALAPFPLRIVLNEGRFIADTGTPDAPLQIPPLTYGDFLPLKLEGYVRSRSDASQFASIDLSGFTVALFIGQANQRPATGFWTIDFGGGEYPAFRADASAAEVDAVLAGYTVTGDPGDYIISASVNGAQTEPTVVYAGSLTVTAVVTQITPGTATTPASWRVELREAAPASCTVWAAGSTTPASTCASAGTKLFRLILDPNARSGFFTLVCGGASTQLVSLYVSPDALQNAVRASGAGGNGAQVQRHPDGGFLIALYDSSTTLTVSDSALVIPANITGQLDLSGAGVRALLDGAQFTGLSLTVRITDASDNVVSEATAPIILRMPSLRAPTSANANLSALALSAGTLTPAFAAGTVTYTASVANGITSLTVTPTRAHSGATITVNGVAVTSGSASGAIALAVGANIITVVVTAADGTTTKTYTITVTRAA